MAFFSGDFAFTYSSTSILTRSSTPKTSASSSRESLPPLGLNTPAELKRSFVATRSGEFVISSGSERRNAER